MSRGERSQETFQDKERARYFKVGFHLLQKFGKISNFYLFFSKSKVKTELETLQTPLSKPQSLTSLNPESLTPEPNLTQTSLPETKHIPEIRSRTIKTEKSFTVSDAVVNRILQRHKKKRIELVEVAAEEGEDAIRILSESHEKSSNTSKSATPISNLMIRSELPPPIAPPTPPFVDTTLEHFIVENPISCVVFIKLLPLRVSEVEVWAEISRLCPAAKPISVMVKSAGGFNTAALFFSTQVVAVAFRRIFIQKHQNKFLSQVPNIIEEEIHTSSASLETILNVEPDASPTLGLASSQVTPTDDCSDALNCKMHSSDTVYPELPTSAALNPDICETSLPDRICSEASEDLNTDDPVKGKFIAGVLATLNIYYF